MVMAARCGAGLCATMLSLLFLVSLACAQANSITRRQKSTVAKEFHHREYHSSVIVNNNGVPYLYIDGGEITTWTGEGSSVRKSDTKQPKQNFTTVPDHNTYAVSLGKAWTIDDVEVAFIDKPDSYPTFVYEALWPDAEGNTFYSYNGGLSFALEFAGETDPKNNELWQFTPSLDHGGEWSLATPPPDSNYSLLTRTMRALQTSHEGLNFALGGTESSATNFAWGDGQMDVPGLVMYNESSQQWYNISSSGEDGYTYMGTAREGAAHFVPTFGPEGLLFVFGGFTNEATLMPFDEAHFFEPVSQQWRRQQVTGTPPAPASGQCVVGVQGDKGTYEIFLYGGITGDTTSTIEQGSVWSLTLPAFHWHRHSPNATYGRFRHTCNTISNDSRQMIVVGGGGVTEATTLDSMPRDPWQQGIGVFDMSSLNWTTGFDPDAEKYVTPDIIKAYYRANGTFPTTWTQEGVDAWFDKSLAEGEDDATGTPEEPATSTQGPTKPSGRNTAMIVGSVVGSLGGLVVLFFIGWLLVRRSRRSSSPDGFDGKRRRRSRKVVEMDGETICEMPDGQGTKEMPARNTWHQGRFKAGNGSVYELWSPENGSPPQQSEEWPSDEKRGVTAPPSMVHPAHTRNSDGWDAPV